MSEETRPAPKALGTVIVATDFSKTSMVALDRAAEIAENHGARLVIVHVLSLRAFAGGGGGVLGLPRDLEGRVRDASRKQLDELTARIRTRIPEVEGLLELGPPAATIVASARKLDADWVVVGTRGLSGFEHIVLGSTAAEIVRTAPCPVLTVHPGDTASLRGISKLLVPTDFSEDANAAVHEVVRLLGHPSAASTEIVLVNADHLPLLLQPIFMDGAIGRISFAEIAADLREQLEPLAKSLRERGHSVEVEVREGEPAKVITELAETLGVDLVAMGTRGRGGLRHMLLGSTAERVVQHARCPVLTVRREESTEPVGEEE